MKKLLIIGAGSVGKFVAYNINQFIESFEIIGFLDDDVSKHDSVIAGYKVLGSVEKTRSIFRKRNCPRLGNCFSRNEEKVIPKIPKPVF